MNKHVVAIALFLVLSILGAGSVFAFGAVSADTYLLRQGEVHRGDLAVNADKAVIEGTVEGDLFVFSRHVQVLGEVTGDVLSFSAVTEIPGTVRGDVRAFTHQLTIAGTVGKNVTASTHHLTLNKQGLVQGSILAYTPALDLLGTVEKEANGMIREVRITGTVGGGISRLATERLMIESTAVIGGDLAYSSPERAWIAPGARVEGTEHYSPQEPDPRHPLFFPTLFFLTMTVSTLILWLLIRYFFPAALTRVHDRMRERTGMHMGYGALVLFTIPILALLLLLTVVGIPLALSLIAALALLSYVAKIFVGSWLGIWLCRRVGWRLHPLVGEGLGILLLLMLLGIPGLGWLLSLAIWLLFLGTLVSFVRRSPRDISGTHV